MRLDVHEGPTVVQPELSVVVVGDQIAEVHELGWSADIELQPLEDGLDRVTAEAQGPLHAAGVDGAGPHPLLDGDVPHAVAPEGGDEMGHAGPVDQMAGQQIFRSQERQLLLRKLPGTFDVRHCRSPYPAASRHP